MIENDIQPQIAVSLINKQIIPVQDRKRYSTTNSSFID